VKLVVLPEADRDFDRLYDFLEPKNPDAAKNAVQTIRRGARQLVDNPEMGVRLEDSDYREFYVRFGRSAYVLRYRIEDDTVYLTRIWHGRENRN